MLAEVVHQVAGVALAEFLRAEVFEPLGMHDTIARLVSPRTNDRIAAIRVSTRTAGDRLELEHALLARLRRPLGRADHVAGATSPGSAG